MKFRIFIPAVSLLLPALIWFLYGGNTDDDALTVPAKPVTVTPVHYIEVEETVRTVGRVMFESEAVLSFKTAGIVKEIRVDEGQTVEQGQLLAQLDLEEIESQVLQARTAFEQAQREFDRTEKLFNDHVATLKQFEEAETRLVIARSRLRAAEFNLEHSSIVAPADGEILKRFIEAHEMVQTGTPVFLFGANNVSRVVRAGVTDRDVLKLRVGDEAIVAVDAYPNADFPARVRRIAGMANPRTGTYEVELQVDNQNHRLSSGFVARVVITPSEKKKAHVIPLEALVEADRDRGYVYAYDRDSDTARRVDVTIARIMNNAVAVSDGLEGVIEVIVEGAAYLADGQPVQVVAH
jgi:membrane fusion protein, multidrug efflux system